MKDVVLLGGQSAISQAVEDDLKETNSTSSSGGTLGVRRVGGTDRYETAHLIATDVAAPVGSVDGKTTALLATGERFPDALAAGPASYGSSLPTVLTAQAALSPAAKTTLTELSIQQVIILGGTAAVSDAVVEEAKTAATCAGTGSTTTSAPRVDHLVDLDNDLVDNPTPVVEHHCARVLGAGRRVDHLDQHLGLVDHLDQHLGPVDHDVVEFVDHLVHYHDDGGLTNSAAGSV